MVLNNQSLIVVCEELKALLTIFSITLHGWIYGFQVINDVDCHSYNDRNKCVVNFVRIDHSRRAGYITNNKSVQYLYTKLRNINKV